MICENCGAELSVNFEQLQKCSEISVICKNCGATTTFQILDKEIQAIMTYCEDANGNFVASTLMLPIL